MIDDSFNNPVTAYLKGKAMQEKKTPIPDRIRNPNVCSYCHSSTVHTITHSCAQMERPLTRQDVLDIGAWFNDEKRMNIGRDVQGKALSLVGDNLRLRDELDHESAAPDLLAALELANELLDNSDVRHYIGHDLGEMSQLHKALNTARAAIAKAKGDA